MRQAKNKLVLASVSALLVVGMAVFMANTGPGPAGTAGVEAAPSVGVPDGLGGVALSTLPPQARHTYERILAGGPFPYEKDGSVFFNRERLLPSHARGYYREYTVKTPGASDRGARRIVCGGTRPTAPEACFYTADHYASFRLLRP